MELIIAFLLGCLWTRTYYARISVRTDWMRSSYWSKSKLYRKLHRINCELCPKRWYCERYKEQKSIEHIQEDK